MKRILMLLIILLSYKNVLLPSEFPTNGVLIGQIPMTSGAYSRLPLIFQEDRQDYSNGGLTFTYDNLWSTIPRVYITIELINSASPTQTYSAVISSNSAVSTTVLVYKVSNGGTVIEASSGEVKVSMLAIENLY